MFRSYEYMVIFLSKIIQKLKWFEIVKQNREKNWAWYKARKEASNGSGTRVSIFTPLVLTFWGILLESTFVRLLTIALQLVIKQYKNKLLSFCWLYAYPHPDIAQYSKPADRLCHREWRNMERLHLHRCTSNCSVPELNIDLTILLPEYDNW